jgi:hypothetical protein
VIVSFTVSCMRQKYLRASINSWARARGAEDVRFAFCLEPPGTFPVAEFQGFLQRSFADRWVIYENERVLGCLRNTRQAMDLAQALSQDYAGQDGFAIVAEEDVEVADDVLEYFAWARDAYRQDEGTVAVCAHARRSTAADAHAVVRAAWFAPLIWGTWADRWKSVIMPAWGPLEGSGNTESWDNNLQQLLSRTGRRSVFPVRSRSLHIGEMSTLMGTVLGEYVYRESVSDCYSRSYPPGEFHEVPYPEGGRLWV